MWPNPQDTADFVTFTEEIFNGKLRFLCSVFHYIFIAFENYHMEIGVRFNADLIFYL